jgi:PAS domain S-box-containing protein
MAGNPGSFEQGAAGNGDEKENRMKGRPAQRRKLPFQRRVRRANRKLKEEALHLAVIEQSPDGIYLVDADTRCIVEANIAFAEMLGYTSDEVQGLSIYDFVAAGRRDVDQRHEDILRTKGSLAFERQWRQKDGSLLDVWVSASAISYGGRKMICAIGRDVTERKRIEQALQESEEKYRSLFEESRDAIYINTPQGRLTDINQAGLELFGYSKAEMASLNVAQLHANPDDRTRFQQEIGREGFVRDYEIRLRRKDGTEMDCLITAILRRALDGSPLEYQGVIRNVTEQKGIEEELRQSEARYRAVVEQSPDGIYLTDIDARRLLEANVAFQNLLGYSPGEIEGLSLYDIVAAEREDIDERIQTILRDDGATFYERQFRRKDGRLVDVLTSSKVISYGEKIATCVLVHDLSEGKRAERTLRESEARYRAVVEQSPDAIYLVDVETRRVLETNSAFQKMAGYSSEEAKGLSNYDLIAVEPEEIDRRFQQVLQARGPLSYERQFRRKDGSVIDVWISANVISYGGRDVACALVRDLTERKRAEQVLKESEELYRAVVEQSVDAIYLVEVGTKRVLEANTAFRNMLGYSAEEILKLTSYDIVAADRNEVDRVFNEILRNEGPVFYERRLRKKDGSSLDVWLSVSVISHGGRKVMAVIARDLTDRKRVEAEINQRNRELTSLLGVSLRLASRLNRGELLNAIVASVIDTLPAAEAASLWLYDEERNELVARAWAGHNDDFFSGLAVSPDTSLVGLVYLSRRPQMKHDTAKEQNLRYPAWPLLDGAASALGVPLMIGEQPIGTLLASNYSRPRSFGENDWLLLQSLAAQAAIAIQNAQLFEQVDLGHKRLQALSQRLVEMQEAERRRIARELHDEIGQALTAVKINLQGAQRLLEAPGLSQVLQETVNTVERTLQQVRGLSLDLRPSMLDDLGLIPALRWHVDRQGQQGGFCARFTADPLEDRLRPDLEIACFRVAQEALTNVIRHAHARQVSVELRTIQEELELIVRDDGVGFDVKAALEKASQGLSLGLLGMEERVRLAGGQASFESIPGRGTQIRVRFPLIWFRHPGASSESR